MNALGMHRVMFAVHDIEDVIDRLKPRGAELVGEVVSYENSYRLAYLRGPRASSSRWPSRPRENHNPVSQRTSAAADGRLAPPSSPLVRGS
ncbi:hypothetical protein [Actinophytocola sp.]|uniref:hypothetical protein n=1 Tax=Actinophytocola sp. TaxID=1872138 RepID=UPI00389A8E9C